jgi:hypothetical protein
MYSTRNIQNYPFSHDFSTVNSNFNNTLLQPKLMKSAEKTCNSKFITMDKTSERKFLYDKMKNYKKRQKVQKRKFILNPAMTGMTGLEKAMTGMTMTAVSSSNNINNFLNTQNLPNMNLRSNKTFSGFQEIIINNKRELVKDYLLTEDSNKNSFSPNSSPRGQFNGGNNKNKHSIKLSELAKEIEEDEYDKKRKFTIRMVEKNGVSVFEYCKRRATDKGVKNLENILKSKINDAKAKKSGNFQIDNKFLMNFKKLATLREENINTPNINNAGENSNIQNQENDLLKFTDNYNNNIPKTSHRRKLNNYSKSDIPLNKQIPISKIPIEQINTLKKYDLKLLEIDKKYNSIKCDLEKKLQKSERKIVRQSYYHLKNDIGINSIKERIKDSEYNEILLNPNKNNHWKKITTQTFDYMYNTKKSIYKMDK